MTPSGLALQANAIIELIATFRLVVKQHDMLNSQAYLDFEDALNKIATANPNE